jgi:hypothetical protein
VAKLRADLLAFNRGIVSPKALARVDVNRIRLSAEVMTNWIAKTQGAMQFRPGLEHLGRTVDDAACVLVPFVAATDDTALLEVTDQNIRFRLPAGLLERPSVSTAISNGSFATSTDWTTAHTGGAQSSFGGTGLVLLARNKGGTATVRQQVTVSGGDQNVEHALRIVVGRGPVTFRCGSTSGGDEYIRETALRTGVHSLSFTPSGNFFVQFQAAREIDRIVTSIAVEAGGVVSLPAPWLAADLEKLRWDQSADVLFVACDGYQQRRIERRSTRSWSVVLYQTENGPFSVGPTSAGVRLKPGAVNGNTTLTSNQPFFKPGHVGALFWVFHERQFIDEYLAADNVFTAPIRVSGPEPQNDRRYTVQVSGTWSGTLRLQRSADGPFEGFNNILTASGPFTGNTTRAIQDPFENQILWYRVGFLPGTYTSGAARVRITYEGGGDYGICRVTGYTSPTEVDIEILRPFKWDEFSDNWREGTWSDVRGWPTAVALHEGRMSWAGRSRFWLSVSDSFENFDTSFEGDAGPLDRSIGRGPVDTIHWMLPSQRLLLGTTGSEISIRSSSFDEPLSPTNANGKACSTQGSAPVPAILVNSRGIYVQRSGKKVFELVYDIEASDYTSRDLTLLSPDIAPSGIRWTASQEQPDTRLHFVLNDGTLAVMTYEPSEELMCWAIMQTDGVIENVASLPGAEEDEVYCVVRRTINGNTRRFIERFAMESEAIGGTVNKMADCFIIVENVTGTTVTGLSHLEGKEVVAWGEGRDLGTYTVSSGQITLESEVDGADVVVGLGYSGPWKSTKLAYGAQMGTALTQPKKLSYLGVIAANMHDRGIKYGPSFDEMDDLPRMHEELEVDADTIFPEFDAPMFEFDGDFNTDSRLYLMAQAPRPVTLLACVIGMDTEEK